VSPFAVAVSVTALKATSGHSLPHCAFLSSSLQVSFIEAIGVRYLPAIRTIVYLEICASVMLITVLTTKDL